MKINLSNLSKKSDYSQLTGDRSHDLSWKKIAFAIVLFTGIWFLIWNTFFKYK